MADIYVAAIEEEFECFQWGPDPERDGTWPQWIAAKCLRAKVENELGVVLLVPMDETRFTWQLCRPGDWVVGAAGVDWELRVFRDDDFNRWYMKKETKGAD